MVGRPGATRRPVTMTLARRLIRSSVLLDEEFQTLTFHFTSLGGLIVVLFYDRFQDAHVCLMDFDDDMSLFGVFDGHGGAEVAQYAVEMLPSLIKNELFKQGEYEKALIKAFMDFDSSLIELPVLRKLRTLRLKNGKKEKNGKILDTVITDYLLLFI